MQTVQVGHLPLQHGCTCNQPTHTTQQIQSKCSNLLAIRTPLHSCTSRNMRRHHMHETLCNPLTRSCDDSIFQTNTSYNYTCAAAGQIDFQSSAKCYEHNLLLQAVYRRGVVVYNTLQLLGQPFCPNPKLTHMVPILPQMHPCLWTLDKKNSVTCSR
jgi:hypothetical protein